MFSRGTCVAERASMTLVLPVVLVALGVLVFAVSTNISRGD